MSNIAIKSRMQLVLDDYAASTLTATRAEELILAHVDAMEMLGSRHLESARSLSCRLVNASLSDGAMIECDGDEKPATVLADFRSFIEGLPE